MTVVLVITIVIGICLFLTFTKLDKEITAGIVTIILIAMFAWQFCMTRQIQKDIKEIKTELLRGGK